MFNFKTNLFELNINPYGNKRGIALSNIEIPDDYSTLKVEAAHEKILKSLILYPKYESDKILIQLFKQLHGHGLPQQLMKPDDTHIHIGLNDGVLIELRTTEYNNEHKIVPLKGLAIKVQEYDSEGNPDYTENLLRALPIVAEDFTYLDYKTKSRHTIKQLYIKDDFIITEAADSVFQNSFKAIAMVRAAVGKILEVRLPFKSKYQ